MITPITMVCQYRFEAIGTSWVIDINEEINSSLSGIIEKEIHQKINHFDGVYSRFKEGSLVTRMSKYAGAYELQEAYPLLTLYKDLYDLTGGLFTPLIGSTLVDAGYDKDYSLIQKKELTQPEAWEDVLSYTPSCVEMKKPALLDFGAAGKGYLVDLVSQIFAEHGVHKYCIDAGGDIKYSTTTNESLNVGLEDPEDDTQVIGVAQILNTSICGSAGNRRKWTNFHHIINPLTRESPSDVVACWVVAKTTILSDALSTCLFFVKPEVLLEKYQFEYVILKNNKKVEASPSFPGELFIR